MKKMTVLAVFLCVGLCVTASYATFPPVPDDAAIYPVEHFTLVALMYSWAEGGELYVRFRLLSERFFACDMGFTVQQNGITMDGLRLLDENRISNCGYFTSDKTFRIEDPYGRLDATQPCTLNFNDSYSLNITPMNERGDMPENGIWRDEEGRISFYLQKYENKSAAVVATTDGTENIIFIDPDYTDGFMVSNDLGHNNYSMNLILTTRSSGIVVAKMPMGTIIENVSLVFPEAD